MQVNRDYVPTLLDIKLFLLEMHNSQLVSGHFSSDFSIFWISPVILTEKKERASKINLWYCHSAIKGAPFISVHSIV